MGKLKGDQSGFSVVELFLALIFVTLLVGVSYFVYHSQKTSKTNSTVSSTQKKSSMTTTDPYAGWKTYSDTGYAEASGISVKYPADWKLQVGGSNAVAWSITSGSDTNASLGVRDIFLTTAETPMQEWNTCAEDISADACGAAPGDITVTGSSTTINGLNAYSATMKNSDGTYYITVIEGNKSTSQGTPFVELQFSSDNASDITIYKKIVASATFPS